MNKFIGMGFQIITTLCFAVFAFNSSAKNAFSIPPAMLDRFKPNISVNRIKLRDRIPTVRKFGAIQAAPRKMRGQLRNGNAIKLMLKNMIRALLQIRVQRLEALEEPFCNFP